MSLETRCVVCGNPAGCDPQGEPYSLCDDCDHLEEVKEQRGFYAENGRGRPVDLRSACTWARDALKQLLEEVSERDHPGLPDLIDLLEQALRGERKRKGGA